MDTLTQIQILTFVHILASIAAVGANVTYFVWLRRALSNPSARLYTLETIRMLERRYVLPAYILAGISGLGIVDRSGRAWSEPWIEISIVLFIALMVVGGFYARLFRRQIDLVANDAPDSEYAALDRKSNILAAVLTVVVVFLIYLMTFQPGLWR